MRTESRRAPHATPRSPISRPSSGKRSAGSAEGLAIADIEAFIREKERWIRRRLAEPRRRPLVWEAGARLPWLGRTVTLALRHGAIGAWLSDDRLAFGLAAGASPRERALDLMRRQAPG